MEIITSTRTITGVLIPLIWWCAGEKRRLFSIRKVKKHIWEYMVIEWIPTEKQFRRKGSDLQANIHDIPNCWAGIVSFQFNVSFFIDTIQHFRSSRCLKLIKISRTLDLIKKIVFNYLCINYSQSIGRSKADFFCVIFSINQSWIYISDLISDNSNGVGILWILL